MMYNNLKIENNPKNNEIEIIKLKLTEYNKNFTEDDSLKKLNLVIKNDNEIIGGIIAGTYWGWLYIDRFWIDENYRNQGIGTSLLKIIENEAINRGCKFAHLDTHDFQALNFYKRNNYKIKAKFKDLPKGFYKYILWKKLK